ncbi:MAG: apolipoprotein N-acyltransferase [Thiohalomonadales bacterium]
MKLLHTLWVKLTNRYVVAVIAGAILPLAFSPFDLHLLAFVSPAILYFLWRNATPKQAILISYGFGLAYFGLGTSWVAVSMVKFGGVLLPVAAALTFLFVFILASYIALAGFLLRRYFNSLSISVQAILVFPALWVITEWMRGWVFTGFPWIALGYSQTSGLLSGFIPVTGVFGISFLLCASAGIIVLLAMSSRGAGRQKKTIIYTSALSAILLSSLVLNYIPWVENDGDKIKVSLLQGNIPQDQKWKRKFKGLTIQRYLQMTRENWDSDIVIWPETALPMYFHNARRLLSDLQDEAAQHNTSILLGLPVLDQSNSEIYYNSVVSLSDDFKLYHKNHLVPFGEFIPFKSLLGGLIQFMDVPMADFSRGGPNQELLRAAGYAIGISICYEDVFGEEVIRGLPEASLLVNVSNDAWFGDSLAPHQHLQMARFRARESGRPMLRATNNGISALVDSRGKILKVSKQFVITTITGDVQPMKGRTPYVIWGNYLVIGGSFLLLLFYFIRARWPWVSKKKATL